MPIAVNCPACGKRHKAPERMAGRSVSCLNCGKPFPIPEPNVEDIAASLLDESEGTPSPTLPDPPEVDGPSPVETPKPRVRKTPANAVASLPPLTTKDPPLWLRHLHWLLALALIPLGASLLSAHDEADSLEDKIGATLENASPAERERFLRSVSHTESLDDLINALPDQRVTGALWSRSTAGHWGLAAAATILFLAFFMFLASDRSAEPLHVLFVGLCTATVGIGFLFLVQALASFTDGRIAIGRSILVLFFYVLKFISFSYSAASDPSNGFFLSFVGFTLGVGLCEELVKSLPLFCYRGASGGRNWRGLFIWGLASGAGFGIAEGVLYSSRYYNGVSGAGTYAVRFLSCVALHAIWSGSVGITLYLKADLFDNIHTWHDWIGPVLFVIGIPMIFHGLYDTCLKREMYGAALGVAVLSFGYLAFLISRLQGVDDRDAQKSMLREYKRRRAAMS